MSNELRFLLIDDHEDTFQYIQEIIKAAYPSKIMFAKSGNKAILILPEENGLGFMHIYQKFFRSQLVFYS